MRLPYGIQSEFEWHTSADCCAWVHAGPTALTDPAAELRHQLANPIEFPPLGKAIVPGDKVVLVLDRELPGIELVVQSVWSVLEQCGVSPGDVTLLQPASYLQTTRHDPRSGLEPGIAAEMPWLIHDPTAPDATGYLSTSLGGERIYLARPVLSADFVLPISRVGYDPLLGYRAPGSALYPGLSTAEAFTKAHGQGHVELGPENERPLRQLVDEIAWLLGIQFGIQVLPAAGSGQIAGWFAGHLDAVSRTGRQRLDETWRIRQSQRLETVLVTVSAGPGGTTWEALGAALDVARSLVVRGGTIIALTDLAAPPGPGIELLRQFERPAAALQTLRREAPPDLIAATQYAQAAISAKLYLLSKLNPARVEELFCVPLENERELTRLLGDVSGAGVILGANHAYAEIAADGV